MANTERISTSVVFLYFLLQTSTIHTYGRFGFCSVYLFVLFFLIFEKEREREREREGGGRWGWGRGVFRGLCLTIMSEMSLFFACYAYVY